MYVTPAAGIGKVVVTVPVALLQSGWVVTVAVGTAGVDTNGFIVKAIAGDIHIPLLVVTS